MAKIGKRTKKANESVDLNKLYSLKEAVQIAKKNATAKFDETVEVAVGLNIDARKAEQNVRGVMQLPHGTGKTYRVAVFARGPKAAEAEAAGADIVGAEDLMEKIQAGDMPFERCVATPDMMGLVGRVGKILGPRGLMPNPKLGTVTMDVAACIKAIKSGQIEYRSEKGGIIHCGVGKSSFSEEALLENITFMMDTLTKGRPAGIKGVFIKRASISTTMGPGVKLLVDEFKG